MVSSAQSLLVVSTGCPACVRRKHMLSENLVILWICQGIQISRQPYTFCTTLGTILLVPWSTSRTLSNLPLPRCLKEFQNSNVLTQPMLSLPIVPMLIITNPDPQYVAFTHSKEVLLTTFPGFSIQSHNQLQHLLLSCYYAYALHKESHLPSIAWREGRWPHHANLRQQLGIHHHEYFRCANSSHEASGE